MVGVVEVAVVVMLNKIILTLFIYLIIKPHLILIVKLSEIKIVDRIFGSIKKLLQI